MSDHLIVIPVFNEAPSLEGIVSRARRHGAVLVVDDGSTDGSGAVASAAGADVLRLDRRRGKGEALRCGFREALDRGVDRVVTLDGDGQHDPDDVPPMLKAAAEAPDALVIGGRLGAGTADGVISADRLAALRVAGFFINWLTGVFVADTQSGFRVYPVGLLRAIEPRRGGFVLETEMLVRAAAAGWRLVEVPVTAVPVSGRPSRFRPMRDGIAVGAYLARHILPRWGRESLSVVAALGRPFSAELRRAHHRAQMDFAAPYRHNPAAWAVATGVVALARIGLTWRDWWRQPRGRCLRLAAAATAATPFVLLLALTRILRSQRGLDRLTALTRRVYAQERLAPLLVEREVGRSRALRESAESRLPW